MDKGKDRINESEYKKAFGIDDKDQTRVKEALKHALDIRKFEIDLYWKRASYFWTLIASAFAAYFLVLSAEHIGDDKKLYAFLIACIGFIFTFSWLQVNRGSKRWQENWENHVDMLEDGVIGPLYKTRLGRPSIHCSPKDKANTSISWLERNVTGPADISVSKTNQIVSFFTLSIWAFLAWNMLEPFRNNESIGYSCMFIAYLTGLTCGLILWNGRTHEDDYTHVAVKRKTKIMDHSN